MRYYQRTRDDQLNAGKRCLVEAERGQVDLALERLRDLAEEFPNDPDALYIEGLVRHEHLGQGLKARELFEQVYYRIPAFDRRCAEIRGFAAWNACILSRDEEEFQRWLTLTLHANPSDPLLRQSAHELTIGIEQGIEYRDILLNLAAELQNQGNAGKAASKLELALAIQPPMDPTRETEARRRRAQALRELDRNAMTHRVASRNVPLPRERLALQEALPELEQALELDPYDAELWNMRSVFCILLERYEEGIMFAESALATRSNGYVKPLINKATALCFLDRHAEAVQVAQEALDRARNVADRKEAQAILERSGTPRPTLDAKSVRNLIRDVLNEASNTANNELGVQGGSARLVTGIRSRMAQTPDDDPVAHARILAELLNDFFPETVFVVLWQADRRHAGALARLVDAAGHVIVRSQQGALARNAARFLALTILARENLATIRRELSKLTTGPLDQALNPTGSNDPVVRELRSFHPELLAYLAGQQPIEEEEKSLLSRGILAGLLALLTVIILVVLYYYLRNP